MNKEDKDFAFCIAKYIIAVLVSCAATYVLQFLIPLSFLLKNLYKTPERSLAEKLYILAIFSMLCALNIVYNYFFYKGLKIHKSLFFLGCIVAMSLYVFFMIAAIY